MKTPNSTPHQMIVIRCVDNIDDRKEDTLKQKRQEWEVDKETSQHEAAQFIVGNGNIHNMNMIRYYKNSMLLRVKLFLDIRNMIAQSTHHIPPCWKTTKDQMQITWLGVDNANAAKTSVFRSFQTVATWVKLQAQWSKIQNETRHSYSQTLM